MDSADQGAPGQVISYRATYSGRTRANADVGVGEHIPCVATIDPAYYATPP